MNSLQKGNTGREIVQLECKEEPTWESDNDSKINSPMIQSPSLKQSVIKCNKSFNFDDVGKQFDHAEPLRSSLHLERQAQFERNICLPSFSNSNNMSKSAATTPVKAFHSISELIKKDNNMFATTHIQPPSNLQIDNGHHKSTFYGNYSTSILHLPNQQNSTKFYQNQNLSDLLLAPATSSNTNSFSFANCEPSFRANMFGMANPNTQNNPLNSSAAALFSRNNVLESSFSFDMAGPYSRNAPTKIRFSDNRLENIYMTKSEPSTPTPLSPMKKSILKKQSNDSMEKVFEEVSFEEQFKVLPQFCCPKPDNTSHHAMPVQYESPKSLTESSCLSTITSNRQILDKRRNLVVQLFDQHGFYPADGVTLAFQQLHKDLFPTKWSLQVKIREVRQNKMKKASPGKTKEM